jgi:hypothetical protein
MMSPATTLLQCWTTLRRFSGPVQDKEEEEEERLATGFTGTDCTYERLLVGSFS